jgi:poly(3-hydroxybutyrate) depolymerase
MRLGMFSKPKLRTQFALAAAIALATVPAVRAADGPALKSYNAAIDESSISGISSGAFMAVQFGIAWSSIIRGVGVVAGGPFYCAQASAADFLNGYTLPVVTATGPCMAGPAPDLKPLIAKVEAKATGGEIDPLHNIKRQKIYLFHGYNDAVVAKSVTDATAEFYRHYLGESGGGNLYYQEARGAGHSFVVNEQGERGLNTCPANRSPFIDQCGYDQAGIILQHIYGALHPGTIGPLGGVIRSFDQNRYTGDHIADALSMGDEGYVFVPSACEQGNACRVHVVLHGCQQDAGTIGRLFVEQTGYNAWADANRIVVLYPQTKVSPFLPFNPNACWDWWSYIEHDDGYVTKSGLQIAAIKAMLNVLTAGAADSQPGPSEGGDPAELIVTDTSDTAAALAWTPVAGATSFRIWRAGADNTFHVVGETPGPSYADQGLAPGTPYAWQVTALVGDIEQPASSIARASTRTTPPFCNTPGTCP